MYRAQAVDTTSSVRIRTYRTARDRPTSRKALGELSFCVSISGTGVTVPESPLLTQHARAISRASLARARRRDHRTQHAMDLPIMTICGASSVAAGFLVSGEGLVESCRRYGAPKPNSAGKRCRRIYSLLPWASRNMGLRANVLHMSLISER